MRIPLPKSKLVTLALVAILGSTVAAASLAVPTLWGADGAPASDPPGPAGLQAFFTGEPDDDREDDEDEDWEAEGHSFEDDD